MVSLRTFSDQKFQIGGLGFPTPITIHSSYFPLHSCIQISHPYMETAEIDTFDGESRRCYSSSASRSQRDVTYICGSCGYDLSLSSSNRNTATIGSKYGKSIKRGMISFFQIDESRFTQADEIQCIPFFSSKKSWGLVRKKTKLLCRKCGNHIGNAYNDRTQSYALVPAGTEPSPVKPETVSYRKFDIRIRALQPSSSVDQPGTPLFE